MKLGIMNRRDVKSQRKSGTLLGASYLLCFYLPTWPLSEQNLSIVSAKKTADLVPGNGLRFPVSIDDETPQIITVDKETDVSSPKWAQNILNQTTMGKSKFNLTKCSHILKIFAVETGVVLDKIVLFSGTLKTSYLAPPETKIAEDYK